jgi:hypothetical protein
MERRVTGFHQDAEAHQSGSHWHSLRAVSRRAGPGGVVTARTSPAARYANANHSRRRVSEGLARPSLTRRANARLAMLDTIAVTARWFR